MTLTDSTIELLATQLQLSPTDREMLNFNTDIKILINAISILRDSQDIDPEITDELIVNTLMRPVIGAIANKITNELTITDALPLSTLEMFDIMIETIGDLFND